MELGADVKPKDMRKERKPTPANKIVCLRIPEQSVWKIVFLHSDWLTMERCFDPDLNKISVVEE